MTLTWLRALVVAGLSLLVPGAGHALLRDWIRAILFAGLFVSTVAVFFEVGALVGADPTVGDVQRVVDQEPQIHRFAVSFVALFCAVDAGIRALGLPPQSNAANDVPSCPDCGRDLDPDLEFCHWCTTRLEPETDRSR